MSASPPDDEALTWAGDEDPRSLARPVRTTPASAAGASGALGGADARLRTGPVGLVLFGVLAGVAVLETVGWVRSGFGLVLGASLTTGDGTTLEVAAFAVNLLFRIAGVAAPLVWFAVVAWRLPPGVRRLGWLAFGALLLVPWPVVVVP